MKIRNNLLFTIIMTMLFVLLTSCGSAKKTSNKIGIPSMMQPNTIIVYDNNLGPIYVQGGQLTEEQKSKISPDLLWYTSEQGIYAKPEIKVDYDQHGEIQNIYYPTPNSLGTYQLPDPNPSEFPTYPPSPILVPMIMQPNTIIVYDSATNYIIVQGGNPFASDI